MAWFSGGLLLTQCAWSLALPAFRGIDEFDHVYRAAAVANGTWGSAGPAQHGRGGLVPVPVGIVNAAAPVCRAYTHTGPDNCRSVKPAGDRTVLAASSAAAYNPAYYLVVGQLTRVFGGDAAVLSMRIATALMCDLLLAWGALLITRWARSPWPLIAYCTGLTPMVTYLTANVNPHALTIAAAALLWSGAISVVQQGSLRGNAAASAVALAVLITTHTLGLLMLPLMVGVMCCLQRPSAWRDIARRDVARVLAVLLATFASSVGALWWIHHAGTNQLSASEKLPGAPTSASPLVLELRWALQSIGAFPTRSDPAPAVTYVVWIVVLLGAVVALLRTASGRVRAASGVLLMFAIGVPLVLTLISRDSIGLAWQGRYALPLWMGLASLLALTVAEREQAPSPVAVLSGFAIVGLATAAAVVHVAHSGDINGAKMPPVDQIPAGGGALVVLVLAGAGCLAWSCLRLRAPAGHPASKRMSVLA